MKKWLIVIFVFLLSIISFIFDKEIIETVSLIRTDFLDQFFLGITFASSKIFIALFLTILFLWKKSKRKWVLPLWTTLSLSVVVSFILKYGVHRMRPFQQGIVSVLPVLEKGSHLIWNFSFPSFRTVFLFSAIPLVWKEFPKLRYLWIIFAGLLAFSRVYFGLHFMSDVLFGGLIGLSMGWSVIALEKKYKFGETIVYRLRDAGEKIT